MSFIRSRDNDIADMFLAADIGDFKRVHSINHAIKGVAGNLVLQDLFSACDRVSPITKSHEREGINEALKDVKRCFDKAKTAALGLSKEESQETPLSRLVDVREIKAIVVKLDDALTSGEVPDDVVDSFIERTKSVVKKANLEAFTSAIYDFDFDHAKEAMLRIVGDIDALDSSLCIKHETNGDG